MKIKISILCCVLFFLISCQQEEEENTDPIIGAWNLIELSGGIAGAQETYNPGDIVWTFTEDSLFIQGSSLFISERESSYLLVEYGDSLFIDTYYNPADISFPYFSHLELNDDEMMINENVGLAIIDNDTIHAALADGLIFSLEKQ